MDTPVKWVAELDHVREVSLLGTADLAFWTDQLLHEDLRPAEADGRAQLLISAADSKFAGVRFRELSVSVLVECPEAGAQPDAAYLVGAYNSCRLFAWAERVFFSTPYVAGDVRVSALLPASIHLVKKGQVVFRAEMATDSSGTRREPSRRGEDGWEGPVFLPGKRHGKSLQANLFLARLRGDTRAYPFLPSTDTLEVRPAADGDALQMLRASHFVPREWVVREDARHAKSRTYPRTDLSPREAATTDFALDYAQAIPLDAEALAEGGIAEAYASLLPKLREYVAEPARIDALVDEDAPRYAVRCGVKQFLIYGPELERTAGDSWGRATTAFFTLVNEQLAGSEVRLYALNGGNDLFGLFLTPAQARAARRALARKADWPYLPNDEPPWYGEYHGS
jgi:hypothetical protein